MCNKLVDEYVVQKIKMLILKKTWIRILVNEEMLRRCTLPK